MLRESKNVKLVQTTLSFVIATALFLVAIISVLMTVVLNRVIL